MSTPNPLIPQGSFQSQASKGASNVRIAVATIVAIHLVFFGGLLLQGCKRDAKVAGNNASDTNTATNLTLPPINTESLYYTNATNLPAEAANAAAQTQSNATILNEAPATANTGAANRDAWQSNNLGNVAAATPETAVGATKEYTVVRGDSFARIAKKHGTTVASLKNANPSIDPAKLRVGSKINIPVSASTETASAAPATAVTGSVNSAEASGAPASTSTYTVKAGDTLTRIAKTHGVTISQIRSANNLKTSRVNVGQKLKIPAPGEGGAKASTNHTRHHAAKAAPAGSSATSTNVP
jgi:LysM repeat protein